MMFEKRERAEEAMVIPPNERIQEIAQSPTAPDAAWQIIWQSERTRLVRLCARLTGDSCVAEDLAQEALLEAWRHRQTLRQPEKFPQWLAGVARNVCLRWARRQGRELAHVAPQPVGPITSDEEASQIIEPADSFDLEIELERQELVTLLDRALASLPIDTRAALLAHYVDESPLAEIAARLGINASAVAMRLQRGKLALRRILADELGDDLGAYGMGTKEDMLWDETHLWCTNCGQRRLMGRYLPDAGELWLWCPGCVPQAPRSVDDEAAMMIHTHSRLILGGIRGYKRAINRLTTWTQRYYYPHLATGRAPCPACGRDTVLHLALSRPPDIPAGLRGEGPGVYHFCPDCNAHFWESLQGLLLATPVGVRFTGLQPRIRTLPYEQVETMGRPTLVTRMESVADNERLTLLSDAETFELLRVYENDRISDAPISLASESLDDEEKETGAHAD